VEDRVPAGLHLELVTGPIEPYVATRLDLVLKIPGVTRATWWANARRDRDDLPRDLPEFDHLVVYETDGTATGAVPAPPAGVRALPFLRTRRPGQGRLTGRPTLGLVLVLISPRAPEGAGSLRDWGDFVHIRHIAEAAVPGYTMITPYEHATAGDPRFLHLYETDDADPEACFAAMTPLVTERLGAATAAWEEWARHPELRIRYVNTFRRLGERPAG
jgi:hypothetical protein